MGAVERCVGDERCSGDERCAVECCLSGDVLDLLARSAPQRLSRGRHGRAATLVLDRLARSETSSAACRDDGVGVLRQMDFTMRRRIYSAVDEDLAAVWPSGPQCRSRRIGAACGSSRRIGAACGSSMALGDTLSSSEALGAQSEAKDFQAT